MMKQLASLALATALASIAPMTASGSQPSPAPKKWNVTVLLIGESSLHSFEDHSYEAGATYIVEPSYRFTESVTGKIILSASQAISGVDHSLAISDPVLLLSHSGWKLAPGLSLSSFATAQIPVSDGSRNNVSLLGAFKAATTLSYDFAEIGLKGLGSFYELAGAKNLHQYTHTLAGKPNTEFRLSNTAGLSYKFLGISLSGLFNLTSAWDYNGASATTFGIAEELSFPIFAGIGGTVGHSNGGNVTRTFGLESNIAFFDPDASRVYGLLSYKF